MLKTRKFPVLLLLAGAMFVLPAFNAASADERLVEATINVSGEGETGLAPDMAVISLSVNKIAPTAGQALKENAEAMTLVHDALKKRGIEDRDMQTSGLSIRPQYYHPGSKTDGTPQEPRLVGYQVINTLSVRLRDVTKVGEVLDESVELGINQSAGVTFLNSDTHSARAQARKAAVKEAMDKAEALAEAAGVKLGRIVAMSENTIPPASIEMAAGIVSRTESTPVAIGENSIRVFVNMSFAINQ